MTAVVRTGAESPQRKDLGRLNLRMRPPDTINTPKLPFHKVGPHHSIFYPTGQVARQRSGLGRKTGVVRKRWFLGQSWADHQRWVVRKTSTTNPLPFYKLSFAI